MTGISSGRVIWITGVPASGKTTLARGLVQKFNAQGVATLWLDSDPLRDVMTPNADYSAEDRDRFYATLGYLAELGARGGCCVVVSATASRRQYREAVRGRVDNFVEILLTATPEALRKRDIKGLYTAADAGDIHSLPGVGVDFEEPTAAELSFDTSGGEPDDLLGRVASQLNL